mmetsp:Transcript_28312/g.77724  ORF Transcript_28312/g.77724 Transcript_28312/m.77724 type:complete len:422 (-) Transcript_28312:37-1302(-)
MFYIAMLPHSLRSATRNLTHDIVAIQRVRNGVMVTKPLDLAFETKHLGPLARKIVLVRKESVQPAIVPNVFVNFPRQPIVLHVQGVQAGHVAEYCGIQRPGQFVFLQPQNVKVFQQGQSGRYRALQIVLGQIQFHQVMTFLVNALMRLQRNVKITAASQALPQSAAYGRIAQPTVRHNPVVPIGTVINGRQGKSFHQFPLGREGIRVHGPGGGSRDGVNGGIGQEYILQQRGIVGNNGSSLHVLDRGRIVPHRLANSIQSFLSIGHQRQGGGSGCGWHLNRIVTVVAIITVIVIILDHHQHNHDNDNAHHQHDRRQRQVETIAIVMITIILEGNTIHLFYLSRFHMFEAIVVAVVIRCRNIDINVVDIVVVHVVVLIFTFVMGSHLLAQWIRILAHCCCVRTDCGCNDDELCCCLLLCWFL